MTNFIRIPLALDLALTALEKLTPELTAGVLPLGGSHFVQLAVLLLLGVAAQELFSGRNNQ